MQQDEQIFEVFEQFKDYVLEHNFVTHFTPNLCKLSQEALKF